MTILDVMSATTGSYNMFLMSLGPFDFVYHLAAEYGRWNGEAYYENLWQTNNVGMKHVS